MPGKYTALSSPLLALTNDDNKCCCPPLTETDHDGQGRPCNHDGRAQSGDSEQPWPRPWTMTYHYDARATVTDDNAPTDHDVRQRRTTTRQWTTSAHHHHDTVNTSPTTTWQPKLFVVMGSRTTPGLHSTASRTRWKRMAASRGDECEGWLLHVAVADAR